MNFSVIAKDNNLVNPNLLSVGLKLRIRDGKYVPQIRTIEEIAEIESDLNNKSNLDIINYYHSRNKTGRPYIVDDKAKDSISIYRNGKLVKSYKAIHGKNKALDDMTVTKTDSKGRLINLSGNLSTPAGIYFSTKGDNYHGAPSWIRKTQQMVDSKNPKGIPSSIHARIITESANTNGCTGVGCSDLYDMAKHLTDKNIPTYILPVDKRNKFFIRNGELQFKSHDITKTPAHNTLVSRPIHLISYDDKGLNNLNKKVIDSYIKGIVNNKKAIQDKLGINNDTYNKLSKKALGILGVESGFGNKNSAVGNFVRYVNKGLNSLFGSGNVSSPDIYSKYHTYGIDGDNNSVGLTQIRMKYVPKEVKALYDEFGITKNSLVDDPEKAAVATIIKLADEYKRRGNNIDRAVNGWNNKPSYLNMVNDKSNRFKIYEKYKLGGTMKSNKLIPKALKGAVSRVNWDTLMKDPEYKKNYNWKLIKENMLIAEDSLINRNAGYALRIGVLSLIIPESGGSPDPHGNGAFGVIGFRGERAKGLPTDLSGQLHVLMGGIFNNPKAKDWTHGGKGTGILTGKEMKTFFLKTPNVKKATNAFMRGFVRPELAEWNKRLKFAQLLQKHMK